MTTFTSWDSELYHHGIKGQKWGIRRFQNEDGSLTIEGQKRYYKELKETGKHLKPGEALASKYSKTDAIQNIYSENKDIINTYRRLQSKIKKKISSNQVVSKDEYGAMQDAYTNAYYRTMGNIEKMLGRYQNKKVISINTDDFGPIRSKAIDTLMAAVFSVDIDDLKR